VSATPPPDPRKPWYEAHPERLEWELAQFAYFDLPAEQTIDEAGVLAIETTLEFKGDPVSIRVEYPFDFPDIEPTLYGPALLSRHQNRRRGNFCLLEQPAADWWPGMAAAELVHVDLRQLLKDSETGGEAVAEGEADMPEPLSQHISADSSEVFVLADPFWAMDLDSAEGEILFEEKSMGNGYILTSAQGFDPPEDSIIGRLQRSKPVQHRGRWAAIADGDLSPWPSHEEVLRAAESASPNLLSLLKKRLKKERKRSHVDGWVGITFPEEGPEVGQRRRGWIFLKVRVDRRGTRRVLKGARVLALTLTERERRIPELVGLGAAHVLVVGAGSVGAPIILELAKAGVGHVTVGDYDTYDVNNSVRHALAPAWAGNDKALAMQFEAGSLNPFIQIDHALLYVGGDATHSALLDQLLAAVDIVIDATGSQSVARILQRRCQEYAKTLVLAALTSGSYGGEVAVFRPSGPCYYCFILGQEDGSVPRPSEGPRSSTTPTGCSTPAFAGAGFDATALAALAARTVVKAIEKCAYPPLDYSFVIVNFRGDEPWQQGTLVHHDGCPLGHE
jgi:molybdopterin/thiamine biosynthesis adenylyltransferase